MAKAQDYGVWLRPRIKYRDKGPGIMPRTKHHNLGKTIHILFDKIFKIRENFAKYFFAFPIFRFSDFPIFRFSDFPIF